MQPFSFYHQHLDKVSRSFSFCINELSSPAKEWVALSYLLLRIVDTIEDSSWLNEKEQYEAFQHIKLFLKKPPSEKKFLSWLSRFPEQLPASEQALLADLPLLLLDINQLPFEIKQALIQTTHQMIDGMIHFVFWSQKHGSLSDSLITTNQYCFFVAGIVGELLSFIFTYLIPDFQLTRAVLNQSIHFGLFLQKINLLKVFGIYI